MVHTRTLRGLVLRTPKLDEASAFYGGMWGLRQLVESSADTSYFSGSAAEPWILGLERAFANSLGLIRLGVDSKDDVDAASRELTAKGIEIVAAPRILDCPGNYYGLRFRDPDGRLTEISAVDAGARASAPADGPQRVSHIVINSTDASRLARFYVDILGFAISDWYEKDYLIFLRCSEDHHSIAVSQANTCSLNHVAFLLPNLEAVMKATGLLQKAGAPAPIWGPGRHAPGGNVFAYFEDPAGFVTEYTAELIQVTDEQSWQPQEWRRIPEHGNVWGTGGPTPRAIALMEGRGQISASGPHASASSTQR